VAMQAAGPEALAHGEAVPGATEPRREAPLSPRAAAKSLISPYWWHMALVFSVATVASLVGGLVMPPPLLALPLFAAILLALAAKSAASLERQGDATPLTKLVTIAGTVALPMFLFGSGMAGLAEQGVLPWRIVLSAIVAAAGIAEVIQAARRHMMFAVQFPCWLGVALIEGSLGAWLALAVAAPIAWYVSRRQVEVFHQMEQQEEAEARTQRRAQEILVDFEETGQGWFWETDRHARLSYVSPVVARALGRPMKAILGRAFSEIFDLQNDGQEGERTLAFQLSARSAFQELAVRAAAGAGSEERWWSISGRPVFDGFGNFVGFRGSGHDLTEKRRSQEQASRLAHFDSLTGLANRHQMSLTLEKILNAAQQQSRHCSVFLLDLDRFKQVNDTLGHPAGDWLLKQVAQRLQRVVGSRGRVGRLGGDEFQIVIPGRSERQFLAELASTIIEVLSQPYSIEGHRVVIGVSVGIAVAPEDGETNEALIRNSDLALYAAKDGGRGRYYFYAQDLHREAEERRQLEHDLRDAIQNGGLELHYQPVVNAATEQISGFEALLRWTHPVHGPLSPSRFVQVAEDTGLIAAIGEWALRTACQDLARMPETVRVAVNVSPLQFANPALPAVITTALEQAGVRPDRLELEITESVFLNDDASTEAMFKALKRIGVRLALDDFGTGYSSLGYLRNAPFDKIKIDQSFVRGATQPGSRNGAIIASITSLADALGMETTAEGVETLDELDLVRLLGCSHVQGYIYDRPMTAEGVFVRLRNGLQAVARGPKAARPQRQTVLRKIILDHDGALYNGTIRNISAAGALVEGLWNVPVGTVFTVRFSNSIAVSGMTRWCSEDRMGIQFTEPLAQDANGHLVVLGGAAPEPVAVPIRRAAR
jgi:diguanylate cyclase (GGDEF)-like protein